MTSTGIALRTELRVFRVEADSACHTTVASALLEMIEEHQIECKAFFVRRTIPVLSNIQFIPVRILDFISRIICPRLTATNAARIIDLSIRGRLDAIFYEADCCLVWPLSANAAYISHPGILMDAVKKPNLLLFDVGKLNEFAQEQFL